MSANCIDLNILLKSTSYENKRNIRNISSIRIDYRFKANLASQKEEIM